MPRGPEILERTPIKQAVVVSDLHINSQLGLYPADMTITLDGGGHYTASRLQAALWRWWREFWDEWVPQATRGEPYCVVVNGDAIDGGPHHNNVEHITANMHDERMIAEAILLPIVEKCDGRLYMVRGTPAHVGQGGMNEETLAKHLDAVPDRDGRRSRWELWLRLGRGLANFAHHIGTTGRAHYETSAIQSELMEIYSDCARWGNEPPDVVVRSHRHRSAETRIYGHKGMATSCTTAAWQLKTPFAWKVPGGRVQTPQIGGALVRQGDEEMYTRHRYWPVERSAEEAPYIETPEG